MPWEVEVHHNKYEFKFEIIFLYAAFEKSNSRFLQLT
jgi:hypothetical protein